jgi:uncharacterized protein (DUF1330 family)
MVAYMIAEIDVHDTKTYEGYKTGGAASIQKYGGRYLTRGGKVETLEGSPAASRVVVLEFDSLDAVKRWYNSLEYQEAANIRRASATGRLFAVEGI